MTIVCAWCPACLAARPEVELDNACPDCRGSEARAERLDLLYVFACTHHRTTTSGGPVPTYGHYDPVPRHPGVGGSKNKRRPTRPGTAQEVPAIGTRTMTTETVSKCICFEVDPKYWTTHYGAVDPATTLEPNYDCPEHFPPARIPDTHLRKPCPDGPSYRTDGPTVEQWVPGTGWVDITPGVEALAELGSDDPNEPFQKVPRG